MNKLRMALLLVGVSLLCFVLGALFGSNRAEGGSDAVHQRLSQLNLAAHYRTLVEVSGKLAAGQTNQAKCVADVTASAHYRELRSCVADAACRDGIEEEIRKSAPELLSGDKLRFRYYENMERCSLETK
jgi:hypothetical protein